MFYEWYFDYTMIYESQAMAATPMRDLHKRVLIVEDEPVWQTLIGRTVRSIDNGAELHCVENVKDALEELKKEGDFDLIIADYFLEGLNSGLDLWKECLRRHPKVQFLVMSSLPQPVFKELVGSFVSGPKFIEKPENTEILKNELVEYFDEA